MKKILFTIISFVVFSVNLFGQSEITQEEYEFFQKYLDKEYVLNRNTVNFDSNDIKAAKKKLKRVPKELFTEFQNRNIKSYRIENKLNGFRFNDEPKPDTNSAEEINFVFDGSVIISRVAFTKDKNQALFFSSHYNEALSGCSPNIYWLVNKSGKWEIKDSYAPYIC